jgi:hypothetical protein
VFVVDIEDHMYADFDAKVREAKPRFVQLIQDVTGWKGVDELADWMINLLCINVGGGSLSSIRPPCHEEHVPLSVPEYTQMLVEMTRKSPDDSFIQAAVAEHANRLRQQFGL